MDDQPYRDPSPEDIEKMHERMREISAAKLAAHQETRLPKFRRGLAKKGTPYRRRLRERVKYVEKITHAGVVKQAYTLHATRGWKRDTDKDILPK